MRLRSKISLVPILIMTALVAFFLVNSFTTHRIDPLLTSQEINSTTSQVIYVLPNDTIIRLDQVSLINSSCTNGVTAVCTAFLSLTELTAPSMITRLGLPLPVINASPFFDIRSGTAPKQSEVLVPKTVYSAVNVPSTAYNITDITSGISAILAGDGYVLGSSGSLLAITNFKNETNSTNATSGAETLTSFYSGLISSLTNGYGSISSITSDLLSAMTYLNNGSLTYNETALIHDGYYAAGGLIEPLRSNATGTTLSSLDIFKNTTGYFSKRSYTLETPTNESGTAFVPVDWAVIDPPTQILRLTATYDDLVGAHADPTTSWQPTLFGIQVPIDPIFAPKGISNYEQINITNSQTTAFGNSSASFQPQQMVNLSLTGLLGVINQTKDFAFQNVQFFNSTSGTVIDSWLENYSFTNDWALFWIKLPNGIGASTTIKSVAVGFGANTTSFWSNSTTGEAPMLSPHYGTRDDGADVFTNYWNFAGTALPAGWTSSLGSAGGSITINNGVTLNSGTGGSSSWGTINYNFTMPKSDQIIVEINGQTSSEMRQRMYVTNTGATATFGGYASDLGFDYGLFSSTVITSGDLMYFWNGYLSPDNPEFAANTPYLLQQVLTGTTFYFNILTPSGGTIVSQSTTQPTTTNVLSLIDDDDVGQTTSTYQWLRMRAYPPNGVMPSTTQGVLKIVVVNVVNLYLQSLAEDTNATGSNAITYGTTSTFTANISSGFVGLWTNVTGTMAQTGPLTHLTTTYSKSYLAAGYYKIIAGSNTSGMANVTLYEKINKAVPVLSLTAALANFTYNGTKDNTSAAITTINDQLTAKLYIGGASKGSSTTRISYLNATAATYPAVFNTSGDQNYSSASVTIARKISQAALTQALKAFPSNSFTYDGSVPTMQDTLSASTGKFVGGQSGLSFTLENDSVSTTSTGSSALSSSAFNFSALPGNYAAAGPYSYTSVGSGNQNYTITTNPAYAVTINKAVPVLLIADTPGNFTYNGTKDNTSAAITTINDQLTAKLYIGGASEGSSTTRISYLNATAATYPAVFNTSGDQNYSSASVKTTSTISRAVAALSIGSTGNFTYDKDLETFTGTVRSVGDQLIARLYVNTSTSPANHYLSIESTTTSTIYSNATADSYMAMFNTTGNQNYSSGSIATHATILKAPQSLFTVTLDSIHANLTEMYGTTVTAAAINANVSGTTLARNGTLIPDPTDQIFGHDYYEFVATVPGNINFTPATSTLYLNVTRYKYTDLTMVINTQEPASFDQPIAFTCSYTSNITSLVPDTKNLQILNANVTAFTNSTPAGFRLPYNSTVNRYTGTERFETPVFSSYCTGKQQNYSSATSTTVVYDLYSPKLTDLTMTKSVLAGTNITSSVEVNSSVAYSTPRFACDSIPEPVHLNGTTFVSAFNATTQAQYDCFWNVSDLYNYTVTSGLEEAIAIRPVPSKPVQTNVSTIFLGNQTLSSFYHSYLVFTDPGNESWSKTYTLDTHLSPYPNHVDEEGLVNYTNTSEPTYDYTIPASTTENYTLTYTWINAIKLATTFGQNTSRPSVFGEGENISEYANSSMTAVNVPTGTKLDINDSCDHLAVEIGTGPIYPALCENYSLSLTYQKATYAHASWLRANATRVAYGGVNMTLDVIGEDLVGYQPYHITNYQDIPITALLNTTEYIPAGWNETPANARFTAGANATLSPDINATGVGMTIENYTQTLYPGATIDTYLYDTMVRIPAVTESWILNGSAVLRLTSGDFTDFYRRLDSSATISKQTSLIPSGSSITVFAESSGPTTVDVLFTKAQMQNITAPNSTLDVKYSINNEGLNTPRSSIDLFTPAVISGIIQYAIVAMIFVTGFILYIEGYFKKWLDKLERQKKK